VSQQKICWTSLGRERGFTMLEEIVNLGTGSKDFSERCIDLYEASITISEIL
jgi:hypothetical protein